MSFELSDECGVGNNVEVEYVVLLWHIRYESYDQFTLLLSLSQHGGHYRLFDPVIGQ